MTYEEFVKKANIIHNFKYKYPKQLIYSDKKIKICCLKHGEFLQYTKHHLNGHGCRKCAIEKDSLRKYMSQEQFIEKCKKYHPEYDYSKVIYKGTHYTVDIICPKHGVFTTLASNLLAGHGCDRCYRRPSTKESFIEAAIKIHGNKYDYSKVNYINNNTKVEIICPKHGSFWSTPGNHLSGKGCFKCQSSKGEKKIRKLLTEMNIDFIEQKRFKDCRDKNPLPFDFYLPKYNLCVEYQGEQHYIPIKRGNISKEQMKENLKKVQKRDRIKHKYCKEKGILLLEIKYTDNIEKKLKEVVPEEED